MKLGLKLIICNLIFSVIIGVVSLTGFFYLLNVETKAYTTSYAELNEVRDIFNEIRKSDGLAQSELIEIAKFKLNEKGYSYYFYDLDHQLVDTNSDSKTEKEFANRFHSTSEGVDVVSKQGVFLTSMALPSGWLVAVDSSKSSIASQKTYYVIYIVSIVVATIVMSVAITLSENLFIMPRVKALTQSMKEVFGGNYEKVISIPQKGKDELSVLSAEFEMLRKKLQTSEKEKEAFDRERGIMISGISHDLRTPLSVIQGYSKGLKDGIAGKIGKEQEYIEKIYSTALSMNELIDKLSAFAKMQSRDVMYTFVEHDLCDLINEFIHKNYVQYASRGLTINGIVPVGKRIIANVDKVQFFRIFQNVCDNSLKYKIKPTATIQLKLVDAGENAEIYLSDDGPGINEFEADYIFESYYRGDTARTNPVSGSGIGLSVVKNIVKTHKGEVVAYNDNGLTIKITMPIRRRK